MEAADLASGDVVSLASGEPDTIVSVVREHLSSPVDVYNFEVADFHTYFVASAGVWVHNKPMKASAKKASKEAFEVRGSKRPQHRYHANKQLYEKLTTDPEFAARLNKELGYDVAKHMTSGKGKQLINPKGMEWHHMPLETGQMRLASKEAHRRLHRIFGRRGGFHQGVVNGDYTL